MRISVAGTMFLLPTLLWACGGQLVGWPDADDLAPTIVDHTPSEDAVDVAVNVPVTVTFSEEMAALSVDGESITLRAGAEQVDATVVYSGLTAFLTPSRLLDRSTEYTATVSADVTDLAGNELAAPTTWTFTTGEWADLTPPVVTATHPLSGATDVSPFTTVFAAFSEPMDPSTLDAGTFTVFLGALPVAGTVTQTSQSVFFHPTVPLLPERVYSATVGVGATDLAGNALEQPETWSFAVSTAADDVSPTVLLTHPVDEADFVPVGTTLRAVFSEDLDGATVDGTTFALTGPGVADVAGVVGHAGASVTFDPSAPLERGVVYTATLRTGITDLAGNHLAADYAWDFEVVPAIEAVAPSVLVTTPVDEAILVPTDVILTAVFDEPVDQSTVTFTSFLLTGPGLTAVAGNVDGFGPLVTFTPDVELGFDVEYTATLTTDITDLAGNALALDYTWTFTVGSEPDDLAPTVLLTHPVDDADFVPVGTTLRAVFTEDLDGTTVDLSTFDLTGPGGADVAGAVAHSGSEVTFDPSAPLERGFVYTATLRTGITDLAGNHLAADYVWTFQTVPAIEAVAPTVLVTTPVDEAILVPTDVILTAVFDEPVDQSTVDVTSFLLTGPGLTAVVGTVDGLGPLATFMPDAELEFGAEYTATLTTDITDLAGNALELDYTWTFTTAPAPDLGRPMVIVTYPEDLAEDVEVDIASIEAAFDEPMDELSFTDESVLVEDSNGMPVLGSLFYDPLADAIVFLPDDLLVEGEMYTVTLTTSIVDLAGNSLLEDYIWTFTTRAPYLGPAMVELNSLETFVAAAGAGLTNSNSSGVTVLNGDVALYPTATCIGDGSPCTLTNPVINGTLYAADPEGIAAQALADLTIAYVDAMARPPGTTVNDLSGLVLPPGVYTSGSTMSVAVNGTVTLDAQGDDRSVWIFQIGSSLTVNTGAQIKLVNGAKPSNVFWAAFASSTIGTNVGFQGTVLAGASNSVGTDSTVVGRLLCTTGQITLLSNTITLPPN